MKTNTALLDNDGRRWENVRRIFSYTAYSPERRSGEDRKSCLDMRCKLRQ